MIVKEHTNDSATILCIVDDTLLGKQFSERNIILDLTSAFFKGEQMVEKDIVDLLLRPQTIYAVGKESVAFLHKHLELTEKDVRTVQSVPHVQVILS